MPLLTGVALEACYNITEQSTQRHAIQHKASYPNFLAVLALEFVKSLPWWHVS
jgi:hypothetical protein